MLFWQFFVQTSFKNMQGAGKTPIKTFRTSSQLLVRAQFRRPFLLEARPFSSFIIKTTYKLELTSVPAMKFTTWGPKNQIKKGLLIA